MSLLTKSIYMFGPYVNDREQKIGKFFAGLQEHSSHAAVKNHLAQLVNSDLATINLWTEYRYKGYKYLTKSMRRTLYQNLDLIVADYREFSKQQNPAIETTIRAIAAQGVDTNNLRRHEEKLRTITNIMHYLSPSSGRYVYRESSSFGRLLQDPSSKQLEGDCNQIVTLYLTLYALSHSLDDLKLTVYPGHVALHFHGVDIETTNGQFTRYTQKDAEQVAVSEIVSINLLDTSDAYLNKHTVPPEVFLESARLAYVLSSSRELVKRNLDVAYRNAVAKLMGRHQYLTALRYAKTSQNFELIHMAGHNGAIHALKDKKFAQARRLAQHSQKRQELLRSINYNEAVGLYNSHKYQSAMPLFDKSGYPEMVKRCYEGLFFDQQKLLGKNTTVDDIKKRASTVRKMHHYAQKSQNSELIQYTKSLLKYL